MADCSDSALLLCIDKEALESSYPCRIYFTRVLADFKCDTFLPEFDENKYHKLENLEHIPSEVMTEKDINFQFEVYEKTFQTENGAVMDSLRLRGKYFDMMAAMCKNRGIGYNGALPWPSLKKEYEYYTTLTATPYIEGKKCACIKGRPTWNSTDVNERRRKNVINIAISRNPDLLQYQDDLHYTASSFDEAVAFCFTSPLAAEIDRVWVLGGQEVYQTAVSHPFCRRVYLTNIHKEFPADRFFPVLGNTYTEIKTDEVDGSSIEESGISYEIKVYERKTVK